MKINLAILIVAGLSLASMLPSFAQRGMGPGNRGTAAAGLYDTGTVHTVSGTVASVEALAGRRHNSAGMHAVLKTDTGLVDVHLGPAWYLDKQSVKVAAGDKITVTGSSITIRGKVGLLAAQVRKGENILRLRDSNGLPLWSRRGR